MNIKRMALLVIVAITFFSVGTYSQTKFYSSGAPVPNTTYSGDNLGFTVTSASDGKIEGFFTIKVTGNWIPLLTDNQPSAKRLDSR